MSSKHYAYQINGLMHGANSIGKFTIPSNIELVTFNRPKFSLDILHVIKLFNILQKVKVSRRLKSQILKSDITDLYEKYKLNYKNFYNEIKNMNIRLTVYKPNETNVPNIMLTLNDESILKKVIGFYHTDTASILGRRTIETNMNINSNSSNFEFYPQSGFLENSYEEFVNNVLGGNTSLYFTTKQLLDHIAMKSSLIFPGKVVRVFLFSCRSDDDQATDEDMAEKLLENISSETISPEIAQQPLLSAVAVEAISKKRGRSSEKISFLKTAKRPRISQPTKSQTKKRKRSGFNPKRYTIRKKNVENRTLKKRKIMTTPKSNSFNKSTS